MNIATLHALRSRACRLVLKRENMEVIVSTVGASATTARQQQQQQLTAEPAHKTRKRDAHGGGGVDFGRPTAS